MEGRFEIAVEAPYAWRTVLGYLGPRSTPGMERVAGERYTREVEGGRIWVEHEGSGLRCAWESGGKQAADWGARVARLFDAGCKTQEVARVLERSSVLRARVRSVAGLRVPGCWEPFELCVRVILGQQVSVPAAHTLMRRLAERCPGLNPEAVANADLSGLGLTGARRETLRRLAERVADGEIRLEGQAWAEIEGRLKEIRGFGPWTLEYLALRLGRDADAFPETDLGLLRAAAVEKPGELRRLAEEWRPYRGYGAMYLWVGGGVRRATAPGPRAAGRE